MTTLVTDRAPLPLRQFRTLWARRERAVALLAGAFIVVTAVQNPQLMVTGVIVGTVLGLGALGLTLTYGVLQFANLGQGVIMMFGAYITYFLYTGNIRRSMSVFGDIHVPAFGNLPGGTTPFAGLSFGYGFLLAMVAAAAVTAGFCVLTDRVVYRRFRLAGRSSPLTLAIASFGISYILVGVIDSIWGVASRNYTDVVYRSHEFLGLRISGDEILIFVLAGSLTVAAYLFLYRSMFGSVMRAMADNPALARSSGIAVEKVVTRTWILVGVLTGVSGTLFGLVSPLNPNLGLVLILPLFAAAAVGGLGSPVGALVGGLLVGVAQEGSTAYVDPGYKVSVSFAILALVLIFKPTGLLGGKT
jgi:branched-chain amino acid transport system permease protein